MKYTFLTIAMLNLMLAYYWALTDHIEKAIFWAIVAVLMAIISLHDKD